MSLLNQMLKDLEQRRSSAPGITFSDGVQTVPDAPVRKSRTMLLSAAGAFLVLLASATFWLGPRPAGTLTLPSPPTQLEAVLVATPPDTQPEVTTDSLTSNEDASVGVAQPDAGVVTASMPLSEKVTATTEVQAPAQAPEPTATAKATATAKPSPQVQTSSSLPTKSTVQPLAGTRHAAIPQPADKTPMDLQTQIHSQSGLSPVRKMASQTHRANTVYLQALQQLQQGKEQEGVLLLQQSIALQPDLHEARQTLAVTWLMQLRQQEAEAVLKEGLQRKPGHPGFTHLLARIRWEQGKSAEAHSMLDAALSITPGDPQLNGLLALVFQQQGRHSEAATHFLAALNSDPSMPSWLIGLAQSWKNMGMRTGAQEALERALQSKRLSGELTTAVQLELEQLR